MATPPAAARLRPLSLAWFPRTGRGRLFDCGSSIVRPPLGDAAAPPLGSDSAGGSSTRAKSKSEFLDGESSSLSSEDAPPPVKKPTRPSALPGQAWDFGISSLSSEVQDGFNAAVGAVAYLFMGKCCNRPWEGKRRWAVPWRDSARARWRGVRGGCSKGCAGEGADAAAPACAQPCDWLVWLERGETLATVIVSRGALCSPTAGGSCTSRGVAPSPRLRGGKNASASAEEAPTTSAPCRFLGLRGMAGTGGRRRAPDKRTVTLPPPGKRPSEGCRTKPSCPQSTIAPWGADGYTCRDGWGPMRMVTAAYVTWAALAEGEGAVAAEAGGCWCGQWGLPTGRADVWVAVLCVVCVVLPEVDAELVGTVA